MFSGPCSVRAEWTPNVLDLIRCDALGKGVKGQPGVGVGPGQQEPGTKPI